jgi:hypothetical protein
MTMHRGNARPAPAVIATPAPLTAAERRTRLARLLAYHLTCAETGANPASREWHARVARRFAQQIERDA